MHASIRPYVHTSIHHILDITCILYSSEYNQHHLHWLFSQTSSNIGPPHISFILCKMKPVCLGLVRDLSRFATEIHPKIPKHQTTLSLLFLQRNFPQDFNGRVRSPVVREMLVLEVRIVVRSFERLEAVWEVEVELRAMCLTTELLHVFVESSHHTVSRSGGSCYLGLSWAILANALDPFHLPG